MINEHVRRRVASLGQFSLAGLMKFVTVCSVLAATSAVTGRWSAALLAAMALALGAKQGMLAIAAFALASFAVDYPIAIKSQSITAQTCVIALGGILCVWYRYQQPSSSGGTFDFPSREYRALATKAVLRAKHS